MKIGIITFWWTQENYGQVLQLFALYEWLCLEGHSVEIIKYCPTSTSSKISKDIYKTSFKHIFSNLLSHINRTVKKYQVAKQRNDHPRQFDTFKKKYLLFSVLEYHSIHDLRKNPPDVEIIICGSDQIWNYISPTINGFEKLAAFTAQFGNEGIKRISYAASFGFSGLNDDVARKLLSNLSSFSGISVREINAKDILLALGAKNVEVVPDPSLLLQKNMYMELINQNIDSKFDFPDVFIYLVKSSSVLTLEEVISELDKQNLSYLATGANSMINQKLNFFPTIPEWLYVIDNSKTIITNSFHGCVFSILFHKNFYYFPLSPNKKGHIDTRIDSLLDRLGIEGRAINSKEHLALVISNPYKPLDWNAIDKKREEFVQVGKEFLAKHLGNFTT